MGTVIRSLLLVLAAACGGSSHEQHAGHHAHAHGGPVGHRFEHADQWAKVFDDPARDAWQKPDAVVAALSLAPGMAVADIGAGTGYFEARLSAAVGPTGKVLALDVEPDMVRYLGERAKRENMANVEAKLAETDGPGLPPESADRILVVDTWHHIADRPAYAKKLAATLRPGGYVLVVDFTLESDKGPPPAHRLTPQSVIDDLTKGGLRASVVNVGLPDQYVIKGER